MSTKDERLQASDQQFERIERDDGEQRNRSQRDPGASASQQHDEAAEHRERDVTREHIGEESNRQ